MLFSYQQTNERTHLTLIVEMYEKTMKENRINNIFSVGI